MIGKRGKTRAPHPDPRVEAQLQHVLSLYEAVRRAEQRVKDIGAEQRRIDSTTRASVGEKGEMDDCLKQAAVLREERASLEAFISQSHEQVTEKLTALGDDALYLAPPPPGRRRTGKTREGR